MTFYRETIGHTGEVGVVGGGSGFDFAPWSELPPLPRVVPPVNRRPGLGVGLAERCAALVTLLVLSPLLVVIALMVKASSPFGPVLYRQERVGLDRRRGQAHQSGREGGLERRQAVGAGQLFVMYKFRTMIPDAEGLTGPVWASQHDPRITKVGRVLRSLRLDEVPQLFNVLAGQMRLIGPRPERPHFVRNLSAMIPDYPQRQLVPPGITGLAQVEREYDVSVDDVRKKLQYDLYYARNRCGILDMKILLKTIDVMLRGRGAH